MSLQHDEYLVQMVNQIAANLAPGREMSAAAAEVCSHLESFWARPMKRRLVACLEDADAALSPVARHGVARLAERQRR